MRLDGVSGRRLATLALLVLASALCVALVAVRISRTGTLEYRFLVWNLFLAWLPFVFALYDGYRRGRGGAYLAGCGVLWLLFLPNAPYILNSWDALVDPARVLAPFAERLDESLVHTRFLAVTVVFTAFLAIAYLLLYAVAQPGLALEPRRPRR